MLTGKSNNDPSGHHFSLNRHLGGHHLALDVSTFANNERTLILRLVSDLCSNPDRSHNKLLHESFFEDVHSMIDQSERVVINLWKEKWKCVFKKYSSNESILHLLNHDVIPYIAGCGIKKLFNRASIKC